MSATTTGEARCDDTSADREASTSIDMLGVLELFGQIGIGLRIQDGSVTLVDRLDDAMRARIIATLRAAFRHGVDHKVLRALANGHDRRRRMELRELVIRTGATRGRKLNEIADELAVLGLSKGAE